MVGWARLDSCSPPWRKGQLVSPRPVRSFSSALTACSLASRRTDPALHPANPPNSFILPPPSIAFTPSPTRQDPSSRLKRTTEWKWLDPEWRVMRTPTSSSPFNNLGSVASVDPRGAAGEAGSLSKSTSLSGLPASLLPHPQSPELDGSPSFPPALGDETLFRDWSGEPLSGLLSSRPPR